jgi:hypothetical protein
MRRGRVCNSRDALPDPRTRARQRRSGAGADDDPRLKPSDAGGGETPALRETGGAAPGGYGLHLVDRIADGWGVTHASMHVWFDLSY